LTGTLALAACSSSLPHPPYSAQATSALTPIEMGPPPGRVESIPKQPAGADAWVNGEWILRHGRWYWLLGRWVKTPEGATYSPWVVVRASDGTPFYAASVWRDAKGATMAPPPGLAFATATGEAVVGPEGNPEQSGRVIKTPPLVPAQSEGQAPEDQPASESPSVTP
jgi:hypothetical protein